MFDISSMSSELNALYRHIHSFAPLKFTLTTLLVGFCSSGGISSHLVEGKTKIMQAQMSRSSRV